MDKPILSRRDWLAFGAAATVASTMPAVAQARSARARMSLNENAWGPSGKVGPAIGRAAQGIERYVDQGEVDALARQIATLERVDPAQVVLGEVLEDLGLYLARQRPGGGKIIYSAPGYTALSDAAAAIGATAVGVPLNSRFENDLPALEAAIDRDTFAVFVVNPHNPSGTAIERSRLDRFVRSAATRTLVIVDEAYLEYAPDFAGTSAVRLLREGANVVVFRTLAKIYALAGLSIGYALAPAPLADALRKSGLGAPHSLNRLALAAASAALADQAHVRQVSAANAAERVRLHGLLEQLRFERSDSQANFIFFRTPLPGDQARQAFQAAGIDVARAFAPLNDWVRITIGRRDENDRVAAVLTSIARGRS